MNSLSNGFFFLIGLSWLLVETCLMASDGNWTPLTLYLVGFAVMFAVLGCLPISDKAVSTAGSVIAVILGASLLVIALASLSALKIILALAFLAFGVFAFLADRSTFGAVESEK